jgi:hypothetical protein
MNLNLGDTQLIIAECRNQGLSLWKTSYVLATAYHETAHTMKPVREYGGEKYLKSKKYYPYVGMGYVQLTWKYNYELASKKLGIDFVKNPKLLLEPKYAVKILVTGMVEGWFTGKKLSDYITDDEREYKKVMTQFANARRIINGTDKQIDIAEIGWKYVAELGKLDFDEWCEKQVPSETPQKPKEELPKVEPVVVPEVKENLWVRLLRLLLRILGGK